MASFWKDFSFPSPVDDILKKFEFTLEELLDEDDVVQDARNHKELLIKYISKPDVINKLIDYVTIEPPSDATEKKKYRYPAIASELLAAEVSEIEKVLFGDKGKILERVIYYFRNDNPNPILSTHICKIMLALLQTSQTNSLEFFRERNDIFPMLLNHIDMYPVGDFFVKMTSFDNQELLKQCMQLLVDKNVISEIVERFDPKYSSKHAEVAQVLTDMISSGVGGGLNSPLTKQIQTTEIVKKLFGYLFAENNRHAMTQGLPIITSITNMIALADTDDDDKDDAMPIIVQEVVDYLPKLKEILNSGDNNTMALSCGTIKPFGIPRIKILELIDSLINLEFDAVDSALLEHDILTLVLDLFFKYEYNNFLHKLVESVIIKVLEGTNEELIESLFVKTKLADKIIDFEKENREAEAKGAVRKSNVAYALVIATKMQDISGSKENVKKFLDGCSAWTGFADTVLKQKKEQEAQVLGGTKPIRTEVPGGGEFGLSGDSGSSSSGSSFIDVSGGFDDDDSGSNSDDDSGDDNSNDDEDDEEDDLDLSDSADMDSENDHHDYDTEKAEILLSKQDIEALLEA